MDTSVYQLKEKITNCGECEYADINKKPNNDNNTNVSVSKESSTCLKGIIDVVINCPHFKQKAKRTTGI